MSFNELFYLALIFYSVIISFILIFSGAKKRLRMPINIGVINLFCSIFAPSITYAYTFGEDNQTGVEAVLSSMGSGNILAFLVVLANAFIIYTYVYSIYYIIKKPDRKLY